MRHLAITCLAIATVPACDFCGGTSANRSVGNGAWSTSAVWSKGRPPIAGEQVVIDAGFTVVLDGTTPALKSLVVEGVLRADDTRDVAMTADYVLAMGAGSRLEIGTEADPFDYQCTITLTGSDPAANISGTGALATGSKVLMAMDGGTIRLHGAARAKTPWTVLGATAAAGATTLTLSAPPTAWAVGDVLCIAPTGFEPTEAERRTIAPQSAATSWRRVGGAALPRQPAEPGRGDGGAEAAAGGRVQPGWRGEEELLAGRVGGFRQSRPAADPRPFTPFKDRLLTLKGINNKVTGDGDGHMRGMGCLLTGIELLPGNVQGGSDTPAGWASGISIDQEIKHHLQANPGLATRFGSLEFGVLVPNKADTWTRMVYAGPNKPVAPIDDPYRMFAKLYGETRDRESMRSVLDEVCEDLARVTARAARRGSTDSRGARGARPGPGARPRRPAPHRPTPRARTRAGCDRAERPDAADQPNADRTPGFGALRRLHPGRHAAIHQLRRAAPHDLARCRRGPARTLPRAQLQ